MAPSWSDADRVCLPALLLSGDDHQHTGDKPHTGIVRKHKPHD
ncbi:hypothetical protein [Acinetobacter sp. YH12243]|nr:hypothetical protein [Acinetobacter sp. YH12243]